MCTLLLLLNVEHELFIILTENNFLKCPSSKIDYSIEFNMNSLGPGLKFLQLRDYS